MIVDSHQMAASVEPLGYVIARMRGWSQVRARHARARLNLERTAVLGDARCEVSAECVLDA